MLRNSRSQSASDAGTIQAKRRSTPHTQKLRDRARARIRK
jgi:hypothetical protein